VLGQYTVLQQYSKEPLTGLSSTDQNFFFVEHERTILNQGDSNGGEIGMQGQDHRDQDHREDSPQKEEEEEEKY
jgi:hypothetical protein